MRNCLIVVISILLCMLVACNSEPHIHSYAGEWQHDETYHWHDCSDPKCEEKGEYAEHDFVEGMDSSNHHYRRCTVCGYDKYESKWDNNGWYNDGASGHYHYCFISSSRLFYAGHTFVDISSEQSYYHRERCSVCGYERNTSENHKYTIMEKDDESHWYQCACGRKNESSVTKHEYSILKGNQDRHWYECVCGAISETSGQSHVFSIDDYDSFSHYKRCECGLIDEGTREKHSGTPFLGDDTHRVVCSICGCNITEAHRYEDEVYENDSSGHWQVCIVCGHLSSSVTHGWNSNHDEDNHWSECKICGYVNSETVKEHSYTYTRNDSKDHWSYCPCGQRDEESVTPHTYDIPKVNDSYEWNECSCGRVDQYIPHEYTNMKDDDNHWKKCDHCGHETTKIAHSLTVLSNETEDYWECSDCGYSKVSPHEYAYYEALDNDYHWKKCACGRFGDSTKEAHFFDKDGICTGCEFAKLEMVSLPSQSFSMGKTEVTYAQWYSVKQWALSHGYSFSNYYTSNPGREGNDGTDGAAPTGAKNEPVTYVSWHDAVVWCNALSEMSGLTPVYYTDADYTKPLRTSPGSTSVTRSTAGTQDCPYIYSTISGNTDMSKCTSEGYRLPTSSEWEKAARAGTSYTYAGSNTIGDVAWYSGNSGSKTHDVGTKQPNAWGLYDMSGNVWEWCWDWYSSSSSYRVLRGGGWGDSAGYCGVSHVDDYTPYGALSGSGFRPVRSVF